MVMLSKADLLPVLDDFNPERAAEYLRNLANPAPMIRVSAKTGDGLQDWLQWLRESVRQFRQTPMEAPHMHPHHHHHDAGPHQDAEQS
jgi:hydrogenase nickel incorporation protein HypB